MFPERLIQGRKKKNKSYSFTEICTLFMLTDYVVELYELFIILKETEMTLSQAAEYMQDFTILSPYCILNSDIFWHLIFIFVST